MLLQRSYGTDVRNIKADFTVSPGATFIDNVSQLSSKQLIQIILTALWLL
jgi:hypothetical protein